MKITNEVWNKKSLIWIFTISDLKIRYRNSVLGFGWTLLEPLLLLAVLYIVFTNVFESDIEQFPLYLLLGLIMWNMLVRGTTTALTCITSKAGILSQIYIPLEIPAISASLTALIMLSFEMIVFGIFLVAFQFIPPITIIILPFILLLEFFLVLGLSFPLSVLNVKVKDVQFVWNIVIYAGFFLHPIFYKIEILPPIIQNVLRFDPMVQFLNFARDSALYDVFPSVENIGISVGITSLVFIAGYIVFRKLSSRTMEDL